MSFLISSAKPALEVGSRRCYSGQRWRGGRGADLCSQDLLSAEDVELEDPAGTLALGGHLQVGEIQTKIKERENIFTRKNGLKDRK